MSRRREAADLALALRLSTQESTPLRNPPYSLSSGSTPSRDSKEMELRECVSGYMGMPPVVQASAMGTVRPADVMMPPIMSGVVGSSSSCGGTKGSRSGGSDPILSNQTNAGEMSLIESFTPSHSLNQQSRIIVPASSGPSVPRRSAHQSLAGSPTMPPPATHLSSTEISSHPAPSVSIPSSESSHRPLFTPTPQTLHRPPSIPTKTYGKQPPRRSISPEKVTTPAQPASKGRTIVLSSSPADSNPINSPNRAGPSRKRKIIDESSDEEEQETIENPPSPIKATPAVKPRSLVSVVLPSREREAVNSSEKATKRHYSPDPLALVDKSPSRAARSTATPVVASSSKSVASGTKAKPSGTAWSTSSRRVSSRVQDAQTKADKEKEERREKRRKEKDEIAVREAAGEVGTREKADRRSTTREKSGLRRGTSEIVDARLEREREEDEDEDEVIIPEKAPDSPTAKTAPVKLKLNAGNKADAIKEKKRKADEDEEDAFDDLASINGSDEGDSVPEKKGKKEKIKATPKGKAAKAKEVGKKGKRVKEAVVPEAMVEQEIVENRTVEDVMIESYEAAVVPRGKKQVVKVASPLEEIVVDEATEVEKMIVEEDADEETTKSPSLSKISPLKVSTAKANIVNPASTIVHRPSPGPVTADGTVSKPGGIKWKTTRSDLSSVLTKLPGGNYGARQSGMSKRLRIAPLHAKIGPPAKAKPPVPVKAVKKKKGEESDEDEDDEEEGDGDDEEGKVRKKKEKGMEWYMMED